MSNLRTTSLDPILLPNWRWKPFLDIAIKKLSVLQLDTYQVPSEFLDREISLGSKDPPLLVKTSTWACQAKKIRQGRAACLEAKDIASVLNLVIAPDSNFDLPFFGADFVTLPTGHLLALDLQPVLKNDIQHTTKVWNRLIPLYKKWQSMLPSGGPIPIEAKPYFSPGFLWTRIPLGEEGETIISKVIKPAFDEYLSLYLDLLINSYKVSEERSLLLIDGQKSYMKYRAENDPAKGMLTRFYGTKWTNKYIHQVLFDLQ